METENISIAAVKMVQAATDHFSTLRLPIEPVPTAAVKRAYFQIALLVHPDKCAHPSAEESFKRLAAAYEVLGSENSQALYLKSFSRQTVASASKKRQRDTPGGCSQSSDNKQWGSGRQKGPSVPSVDSTRSATSSRFKSFNEMQREFDAMEHKFEAANEAYRNSQRAADIARQARQDASASVHSQSNETLVAALAMSADDRAEGWRAFQRKGAGSSKARGSRGERDRAEASKSSPLASEQPKYALEKSASHDGCAGAGSEKTCCWLCRRAFSSAFALARHEAKSELHKANLGASVGYARGM